MLKLVQYEKKAAQKLHQEYQSLEAYNDHNQLIEEYIQSHRIRGHSQTTIKKEQNFLTSWFENHGNEYRPLYTWEAMEPVVGRKRIMDYANALIDTGITTQTIRSYLGILSRYFSYVLEHPFILRNDQPRRIQEFYNNIDQPISEYDIPHHAYDGERLGVPIDPEKLYDFYALLRKEYLGSGNQHVRSRNYAMAVLAGESGLRVDELLHLEISKDLFFESKKLQTRFAKGMKGSGKRARLVLFTPLARDTLKYYLNEHRRFFKGADDSLFISQNGTTVSYSSAHQALREMIRVAQKNKFPICDHMSWHWFRRAFSTLFIERFPNRLSELVELLGHVTPNTVHCYIRHSRAWMDEKIKEILED